MYETSFHLQRRPFPATPDPGCVYLPGSIQTVFDELVVCLERGEGIAVLTAPAGLGKTLLCEAVKQELGTGFTTILLRHGHFTGPADLLMTLLAELGQKIGTATLQQMRLQFVEALADLRQRGQLLAVIADEAHQLSEEVLEEFRQLVDHADHGVPWARLLLSGQLELEEKLAGPELSALNQRLRTHVSLSPLTSAESLDYLDYRITWAGGRTEEVFQPGTMTAIVAAADGVPRCLNQLADHVLLLAYVADRRPATADLVKESLSDLRHLPLSWNISSVRSTSDIPEASPRAESFRGTNGGVVEFGEHLSGWESSPTFSPPTSAAAGFSGHEVWEFGAEAGTTESEDEPEPEMTPESSAEADPFETLLHRVESEIEQLEQTRAQAGDVPGAVEEIPVVDRYAAIDAGWSVEDHPAESLSVAPVPQAMSKWSSTVMASEAPAARDRVEHQLRSDMIELAAETHDAVSNWRIDRADERTGLQSDDIHPQIEVVETPAPTVAPDRPFRNLFTRLRRKQKGME